MSAPSSTTAAAAGRPSVTNLIAARDQLKIEASASTNWTLSDAESDSVPDSLFFSAVSAYDRLKLARILGGCSPSEEFKMSRKIFTDVVSMHEVAMKGLEILFSAHGKRFVEYDAAKAISEKYRKATAAEDFSNNPEVAEMQRSCERYVDFAGWVAEGVQSTSQIEDVRPLNQAFSLLGSQKHLPKLFFIALVFDEELSTHFRQILDSKQQVFEQIRRFRQANDISAEAAAKAGETGASAFTKTSEMVFAYDLAQLYFIKKIFEKADLPDQVALMDSKIAAFMIEGSQMASPERIHALQAMDYRDENFETNLRLFSHLLDTSGLIEGGNEEFFDGPAYGAFRAEVEKGISSPTYDAGNALAQRATFAAAYHQFWNEVSTKVAAAVEAKTADPFWSTLIADKLAEASAFNARYSKNAASALTEERSPKFESAVCAEVKHVAFAPVEKFKHVAVMSGPSTGLAAALEDSAGQRGGKSTRKLEREKRREARRGGIVREKEAAESIAGVIAPEAPPAPKPSGPEALHFYAGRSTDLTGRAAGLKY